MVSVRCFFIEVLLKRLAARMKLDHDSGNVSSSHDGGYAVHEVRYRHVAEMSPSFKWVVVGESGEVVEVAF